VSGLWYQEQAVPEHWPTLTNNEMYQTLSMKEILKLLQAIVIASV
jgi:hypothetical protein